MTRVVQRWREGVDLVLSVGTRAAGIPLAVAINLILARLMGVEEFGRYLSLLAVGLIGGGISTFGVDRVFIKEFSRSSSLTSGSLAEGLRRWGWSLSARISLGVIALAFLALDFHLGLPHVSLAQQILAVLVAPASASTMLVAGELQGLGATIASQSLSAVVKNGLVLFGIGVGLLFPWLIGAGGVLLLQVLGYLVGTGLGLLQVQRLLTRSGGLQTTATTHRESRAGPIDHRPWNASAAHFFVGSSGVLLMSRLDVVMINGLAGAAAAGLFGIANRVVQAVMAGGVVTGRWLQPRLGVAMRGNAPSRVRSVLFAGALASFVLTAVPAAALWVLAPSLGSLLGSGFTTVTWPLRWLLLGAIVWGATAPAGLALLSMTGRERTLARIVWIEAACTLSLILVLAPVRGATGGAIAYGAGLVVTAVLLGIRVAGAKDAHPIVY